jgi:hypothetical protein
VEQGGRGLQQHYPERVTPLIRRWLGEAADYGEV